MSTHPWDENAARTIIEDRSHLDGALMPVLHALQDAFGYVDSRSVPIIADILNLSRADVHGTISFYHEFRHQPAGRHVIRMCRAESCQAQGGRASENALREALNIDFGETTPDGACTLEAVYCLGNCMAGPSAQIDGELVARVTPKKAAKLAASLKGGK